MPKSALLCLLAVAVHGAGIQDRFAGVWKLVSFETRGRDGSVTHPFGENPVGRITYDKAGRMSAQLMRPGRRSDDRTGFFAYFGTYRIDEASRTVVHHVEACLAPAWVGTDVRRTYEFSGNRLILTVTREDGVGRLVWEREPD